MSPFRNSFSTCMWIKRIYTSSYPTVVQYYSSAGSDLYMTANGYYTYVVNDAGLDSARSKFVTPAGQWFSLCLTWSLSSRTGNLYLNGELIGTDQTSSGRSLTTGGQLWFGRPSSSYSTSSGRVFGGELYQYNMFAEVLSAATIKKIADDGLCFDLDELSETRLLRWEDILKKSRSGSVKDSDTGCKQTWETQASLADAIGRLNETETELNETETELRMVKKQLETLTGQFETVTAQLNGTEDKLETETGRFNASQAELDTVRGHLETATAERNSTEEQLQTVRRQFNRSEDLLETCSSQLNKTEDKLDTTSARLNSTQEQLETIKGELRSTQSQLDGARKFKNITRWDVLYTSPYYNKIFTEDLFGQLTTSWEILRNFVGANITEGIVNHFQLYHDERFCDAFDELSAAMLKQFYGVELTYGIIDHLRQHLEESACDNTTKS
ncbi:uncharacterized protein LOC134816137 [Bolinopsis microptera]|uniref:uncharacterized protein LOC134816137 n=1 Tax=Bolinopsis microptera TaxID=2820187 RepID=UPI00307A161C